MQIHATRGAVKDGELPVRLNPGTPAPFAIVGIGFAEIYLADTADCDRLIRAAIAAKDLLIEATGAQVRFPASLPPELADPPEPPDFSDAAAVAIAVDAVAIIAEAVRTGWGDPDGDPAGNGVFDALLASGCDLVTGDDADGGHVSNLYRPDGTHIASGHGATPMLALEDLRGRLAGQAATA